MTSPQSPLTNARRDLLGLVAASFLAAFEQAAAACAAAPEPEDKLVLARLASSRLARLDRVREAMAGEGVDAASAMVPFVAPMSALDVHTRPRLWAEACLKVFVMDGLATDLVAGVADHLDGELAQLLTGLRDDEQDREAVQRMLVEASQAEPDLAGRLSLYGRRVLGETLSQAQRVAAARPDLTALATGRGDGRGDDLAAMSELMATLGQRYVQRMESVGLG